MGRKVEFVLNTRWEAPDTLGFAKLGEASSIANSKYSRHHVAGRKYMQMLSFLLETFDFSTVTNRSVRAADHVLNSCDVRVRKIAGYTNGSAAHALRAALFWSPVNLFVGPSRDYRTFDPGSGVEPIKPLSFDVARWKALKEIPDALDQCGVSLLNLVNCSDGETLTFNLKVDDTKAKKIIGDVLTSLNAACGQAQAQIQPWRFSEDDWSVVDTTKDTKGILAVTSAAAAENQYTEAKKGKLINLSKTWADVAAQEGTKSLKMILKTA
jgi:hypothetical protein